jgi:hypothetical protein
MAKSSPAKRYMAHVATYKHKYRDWLKRADMIDKIYRDADRGESSYRKRFNILWSNVQTIKPALYSRTPQPDVSRRYKDSDPVGRLAANMLERTLDFEITHYRDYADSLTQTVYDRLLPGRGQVWVRYEPHFSAAAGENDDGPQITEDADESGEEPTETIEYECAPVDYINWEDFGHNVSRTWEEVTLVWRRAYMSRAAMVKRFGGKGKKVPLDATGDEDKSKQQSEDDNEFRGRVLEFWDRDTRSVTWIAEANSTVLDEREDPLGLESFFPCPKPLYATLTNKSLIPTPDYTLYQDQALQLDLLETRIDGLIDALQVRGACSAAVPGLAAMLKNAGNLQLIEVANWAAFSEKGGLKGALELFDLSMIAAALERAIVTKESVVNTIFQISGIADIIRGQSDPRETLGAQQIKSNFAGLRLRDMQKGVAEFATEVLRLKGEVICKHFNPQTILQMSGAAQMPPSEIFPVAMAEQVEMMQASGQPLPPQIQEQSLIPQALQMLKSDPMRKFRVEIAADTLVQIDEDSEKQETTEFLSGVGEFLAKASQVAQVSPATVPFMVELLSWASRRYKVGKTIEGQFDELAMAAKKQAQQPPPPDPKQMEEQITQKVTQQVQMQHAQKELALNKRASDLDIREVKHEGAKQLFNLEVKAKSDELDRKAQVQDMTLRRAGEQADQSVTEHHRQESEATQAEATKAVETIKGLIEDHKDQVEKVLGSKGADGTEKLMGKLEELIKAMAAPRELVRDQKGRPIGSRMIANQE